MDKFKELAEESDNRGARVLKRFIPKEWTISVPDDFYSVFDLLLTKQDGSIILVEVKVRSRVYNPIMLEYSKAKGLVEKRDELRASDVWYLTITDDEYVCFSLQDVFRNVEIITKDKVLSFPETMRFPDNILIGRIDAPRYTASNSGNIDKWCYFIPTKYAFQRETKTL